MAQHTFLPLKKKTARRELYKLYFQSHFVPLELLVKNEYKRGDVSVILIRAKRLKVISIALRVTAHNFLRH